MHAMKGEGVTPILKISIRIAVMAGDTQIAKTSVLCSLKFFNSCLQGQLQEQLHKLLYGWFPGQPSPVQPYRQSRAVLQMDLAELPWVHTGCGDGTSFIRHRRTLLHVWSCGPKQSYSAALHPDPEHHPSPGAHHTLWAGSLPLPHCV